VAERLTDDGIQAFLATKEVVALAVLGPDGAPTAIPMWFVPDGDGLAMISVAATAKVRNLGRDGRVSVAAEGTDSAGRIRGVVVHGRADFLPESSARQALVERFLDKYRPRLERLWGGRAMPPSRVMFRIAPQRVRSWGLDGRG
jgi:PPOX class probable F420-dependent enzyme